MKFPWAIPERWDLHTFACENGKLLLRLDAFAFVLELQSSSERDDPVVVEVQDRTGERKASLMVPKRYTLDNGFTKARTVVQIVLAAQEELVAQGVLEGTPTPLLAFAEKEL